MFSWPYLSTSTLAVQGAGFWLAIIGMAISVVGFWLTIKQLTRTEKATVAVAGEVRRIQFAMSKFDATIEASRAEALLDGARTMLKGSEWDKVGEAMEAFSKSLHTLRELKVPALLIHEADLEAAMTHAIRLCERLDRTDRVGLVPSDTTKTLSSIRDTGRLLTSVRIALERSTLSE